VGPGIQREPLATSVVLIVGLGPKLDLLDKRDPRRPARSLGSFLAGLDDSCAIVAHDGTMRGIQVDLTPLAARMLFGVPMYELARETLDLEDVLERDARLLEEQLYDADCWERRFALIEAAILVRLANADPAPADVEWAWRRLVETHGRLRIVDLAGELGCSRKHLAARFREHVGLSPKLVARMPRFSRASTLIGSYPDMSLAEMAAACGYYDQAHLDRDFGRFADTSPTAFRAKPVTFVQDTPLPVS
jgi:AraC-like DNA-binding protein